MGKIRIKTLGDEKKEKEQKKKAEKRSDVKKTIFEAEKIKADDNLMEKSVKKPDSDDKSAKIIKSPKTPTAKIYRKTTAKKQKHSSNYMAAAKIIDKNKIYPLKEALDLMPKLKLSKFDETVELHINTLENGISGSITFPHGTGKQTRVEIVNLAENPKHLEEIVKKIETGKIDFDILIATPESMPKLARVAKFLGPRGLMPNPKNGTVTPKPEEIAKKYQAGQINFKTEAKFPLLHLVVGKVSFGNKKLEDNIKTAISVVQTKNIKSITLKSTMSAGIKLDFSTI